jgi:hypothetical protein
VPNLLKFAFNMNTAGPDNGTLAPGGNGGLPVFSIVAGPPAKFRVEYIRRKNSGLLYTPRRANGASDSTPMTGTPVVTSIDADFERVVIEEPLGSPAPSTGFSRVSVTVP